MLNKRKLLILIALLAATGLSLWLYWKWQEPPRTARVLPDGDRLLYANLAPLRLADWKTTKPLQLERDYQQFVDQTGIHFERDLKGVSICWRDTRGGADSESAAVFVARFDLAKLRSYLQGISSRTDAYHNRTVYSVAHEGRTDRVAILDNETVAVTNMADPDAISGMIDRWDRASNGSDLLTQYYKQVPAGSLAWLIDRFPAGAAPQLPGGLSFNFLENKTAVVSARYNGDVLLRAEILAADEADARHVVDSAGGFLSLYRSIANSLSRGNDRDVNAAIDSIRVEQKGSTAVFTATLSQNFLKKVAQEAEPQIAPVAPSPLPTPEIRKKRGEPTATLRR